MSNFEKYMTPPTEYVPSEDDLFALKIAREILEDGKSVEMKLDVKTNQIKVYEIKRKGVKKK